MGVEIHKRPQWLVRETYLQLKKQKLTDRFIYENILYVSLKTFTKFKRELGVLGVGNQGGHNRKINREKAKELQRQGYSMSAIGKRYGCSRSAIYKVLKKGDFTGDRGVFSPAPKRTNRLAFIKRDRGL